MNRIKKNQNQSQNENENKNKNAKPINIVLFQGYLGSKMSQNNTYEVLETLFSKYTVDQLIITRGMGQPVNPTNLIGLSNHLTDLSTTTKKDHRKMVFFFDILKGKWKNPLQNTPLTVTDVRNFITSIKVHAVLIGSSNVSFETYYNSPANKGEADLFLFTDEMGMDFEKDLESKFFNQSEQSEQSERSGEKELPPILSKSTHIGSVREYDGLVSGNPHQLSTDEKYLTLILYYSLLKNIR
ncbi:TPA: hypothetical protein ACHWB5_001656 [Streptococcus suis]